MDRTSWFAIVIISLALQGIARGETSDPSDPKSDYVVHEHPLLEAPTYTDPHCGYVEVRVIADECGGTATVRPPLDTLTVALRDDGKDFTSLRYWGDRLEENNCKKAVLLVPVKDDVAVWQSEIDRWKKMRQDYLDSLPKPRRILPKKH